MRGPIRASPILPAINTLRGCHYLIITRNGRICQVFLLFSVLKNNIFVIGRFSNIRYDVGLRRSIKLAEIQRLRIVWPIIF